MKNFLQIARSKTQLSQQAGKRNVWALGWMIVNGINDILVETDWTSKSFLKEDS